MDGSTRAGARLGDKGKGQGLGSDGIHTGDVEIDIVRGELSFLHFSCWKKLHKACTGTETVNTR